MRDISTDPLYRAMLDDGIIVEEPEADETELTDFQIGIAVGLSAGGVIGAAIALATTGWFG